MPLEVYTAEFINNNNKVYCLVYAAPEYTGLYRGHPKTLNFLQNSAEN